jgi:glycosyltransferase involved in cell wall biosynthesis
MASAKTEETPLERVPVAIVAPVYRNAETLAGLAERVRRVMLAEGLEYRLVLVVDASPDSSWDVVQRVAAEDARIAGLLLSHNIGQHRAIIAGLRAVEAQWFVVMDADLQDPPELIPALLRRARESAATVFARRSGQYQRWDRMVTSRAFKTILGWMTGVPANVGTFFVVNDTVADALRRCGVRHPQVVVLAHYFSQAIAFVPFERSRRPNGRSAYSAAGRMKSAARALRCWLECRGLARQHHVNLGCSTAPIAQRVNV